MAKLTKTLVEQAKLKDKNYYLWDDEIKGFGCLILASGAKRTYDFMYRSPTTKTSAKIKIGCHGNITVDFARKKALELSLLVASGIDPRDKKKQAAIEQKRSILLEDFSEIFKEKHMPTYKGRGALNNKMFLNKHILPYFCRKPMADIVSKDIKQFLESLSHRTTTANRCFALLSIMFKKAEEWEYLPPNSNPCRGVSKYKENKKQRFLSRDEFKRLEQALDETKTDKGSYYTVNAIRFALYLGLRKGNILNLKWEDVHLKECYIHLPDTKTGENALPLNGKAIELLSLLERKSNNPYVFPGKIPGKPLAEIKTTWTNILKRAKLKDLRFHDLRHTFASYCLQGGLDLYTTSKLLGHKNIQTTTRYAHFELEHLKKATNQMAKIFE